MVPCKNMAEEVSFEWSNHRVSSTDSKVGTTLHVSMHDSGTERVNALVTTDDLCRGCHCIILGIGSNFVISTHLKAQPFFKHKTTVITVNS